MTRTSRRLKQKPTHTHTHTHTHTQRLPLLRSGRDPAPPFDPVKLALTDRIPRYTASCASLLSALPLPPLRRRGVSTIVGRGPTGLRPSTRKERDGKEGGEARLDTQLRGRAREAKR